MFLIIKIISCQYTDFCSCISAIRIIFTNLDYHHMVIRSHLNNNSDSEGVFNKQKQYLLENYLNYAHPVFTGLLNAETRNSSDL